MADCLNAVIDLSHHNAAVDFARLKASGIVGVIHKATQGLGYVDRVYAARRSEALAEGLLWGAYHFGVGADGSDQADFFLNTVKPDRSTLLVLDYEQNPVGATMSLAQCREFVDHTQAVAGRYPILYSGHLLKEQLGGQVTPDPTLRRCPLWVAQYNGPRPLNIPPTFAGWTFWQYTDGVHGQEPHTAEGVGPCDRDMFNGTLDELKALWCGAPKKMALSRQQPPTGVERAMPAAA